MDYMPSATKGVVLTSTGEILATPSPTERVNLFNRSPKVGLNFGKSLTLKRAIAERRTAKNDMMTGLVRPRARARRRRRQRIKTRTMMPYQRILHPHLVRVHRPQESSQLSQQHLHRQGFVAGSTVDTVFPSCITQSTHDVTCVYVRSCWVQYQ